MLPGVPKNFPQLALVGADVPPYRLCELESGVGEVAVRLERMDDAVAYQPRYDRACEVGFDFVKAQSAGFLLSVLAVSAKRTEKLIPVPNSDAVKRC